MIAEVFPEAYDTKGRPTFRPDQRRRSHFPSSFPIGRYISQPLSVECKNLEDLRGFLRKCRYVSDEDNLDWPTSGCLLRNSSVPAKEIVRILRCMPGDNFYLSATPLVSLEASTGGTPKAMHG